METTLEQAVDLSVGLSSHTSLKQNIAMIRIHGDNILECERALMLIADAFLATVRFLQGPVYAPQYEIIHETDKLFSIQLLPGYGRWGIDAQEIMVASGAPLREASDAIITRVLPPSGQEEVILAVEFCNALPAGNNAWQRNGRALTYATVKIPYLYFAEIGGFELGQRRIRKATRFPSPIVPFSYLTATKLFNVICLPVYMPSLTITKELRRQLAGVFGFEEAKELIKSMILGTPNGEALKKLARKDFDLVQFLSDRRRRAGTLNGPQWNEFMGLKTASAKARWLSEQHVRWVKKVGEKVRLTSTSPQLIAAIQAVSHSVGANDIPLCMVPADNRKDLAKRISGIYGSLIRENFLCWVSTSTSPLVIAWITGFKPRGEDSRPDRGLVPLARMLFGNDVEVLSIVSGPAKKETWSMLLTAPEELAKQNGLWEAILHLSDAVLVDSITANDGPIALTMDRTHEITQQNICFPVASTLLRFSEHDVDTILHLLFTCGHGLNVFEAMCNPPGGDWSGLSLLDLKTGNEYRWTSLPRITSPGSKRPDHVIQFWSDERMYLLAIESKNRAGDLEIGIGDRLKRYVEELLSSPPTISRNIGCETWSLWETDNPSSFGFSEINILSGGAFYWANEQNMNQAVLRGRIDVTFAFEFGTKQDVLMHLRCNQIATNLLPTIVKLVQHLQGGLKVKVY